MGDNCPPLAAHEIIENICHLTRADMLQGDDLGNEAVVGRYVIQRFATACLDVVLR